MRRCLVIYGITCSLGQILALRELAVAFQGNELVFGAALAIWLLLVAVGCGVLGRAAARWRPGPVAFASTLAGGGALVPITVLLIRVGRFWLAGRSGIALSFGRILILATLTLAPLCVTLGLFYVIACRIAVPDGVRPGRSAGRVYLYESLGSCMAGAAFTLILARVVQTFTLAWIVAGVNAFAALSIWWHGDRSRWRWGWVFLLISGGSFAVVASPVGPVLDFASQALRFPGRTLRASTDSPYGRVEVVRARGQTELYENGVLAGATGMTEVAEETVLPPVLAHPEPRRALLVGGAATGAFSEALRLPWLRVDCIEPDPALVAAAVEHGVIGEDDINNVRGRLITDTDARRHIRAARGRYDVIILSLPNPTTGLLNRFYTREFFLECRRALRRNGILGFQIEGTPDYMSGPHRAMAAQVERTLRSVFRSVAALPSGHAIHFLATAARAGPFPDGAAMRRRMRAWRLAPRWLTADEVGELTHPARVSRLVRTLRETRVDTLNTDLRPLAYLHALRLWAEAFEVSGQGLLHRALGLTLREALLAITAFALLLAVVIGIAAPDPRPAAVLAARVGAGAAGFLLEMILLFALQSFYGYIYSHIGLLFAAFMGGLAVGAAGGGRMRPHGAVRLLMLFQAALAFTAAAFVPLLRLLSGPAVAATPLMIPALNFGVGTLVGVQYPLGVAACAPSQRADSIAAGLYAMDLLGACIGALLGGAIIIPVLGLLGTCWVASATCLAALPLLLIATGPGRNQPPGHRAKG